MSLELAIAIVLGLAVVLSVAAVPAIRGRFEVRRLQREYQLTDEEVEAYLRELPEICHAVAGSMEKGTSTREIERIASESAIMGILRARQRRTGRGGPDPAAVAAQAAGNEPRSVTREDLEHRRRREL